MEINEIARTLRIDEKLKNNVMNEKLNTDLNLNVSGKVLKCHRSILTTASPYFVTKLKSNKAKNEIDIDWPDIETFENVLEYIYSGKIELNDDNFDRVCELSSFLCINKLKEHCEKYIELFINLENCLKCKELCENLKLNNTLCEHCLNFINENLMNVLDSRQFLDLSFKSVELFFTDPVTGCDNIPLINLIEVLGKWVAKDIDARAMDYQKLLAVLDWSSCPDELFDYLKKEKLFEESKLCLCIVLNAIERNKHDLGSFKRIYAKLKDIYVSNEESSSTTSKSKPVEIVQSRSTRSSKRTNQLVHQQTNNNPIIIVQEKRPRTQHQNNDLNQEFDDSEYDIELLFERKNL